jgi:hypothetical protein
VTGSPGREPLGQKALRTQPYRDRAYLSAVQSAKKPWTKSGDGYILAATSLMTKRRMNRIPYGA